MAKKKSGRLATLDLGARLPRELYEKRLAKLQMRLREIQQAYLLQGRNAVVVFEGWDAAGKGGCIRRISAALDPRGCKVWPIGAPRDYFAERHYLARFWDKLPGKGAIAIFDRSWYGRVLVERVEGYAPKSRWKAAYDEINTFERMLVDDGVRVIKIFLYISQEEQLRRFEDRLRDPLKRWKLSYEDFRNRGKWDAYVEAAEEMFSRTEGAEPWRVLSSEDKKSARIEAIDFICRKLAKGVDLSPPAIDDAVISEAIAHFDLDPELVRSLAGRAP
ncbi:MAG: polyphosphate kinase 2 family protein [Rubrimonas sp.]|uniref:polyphosphate kinase 2 family protein n=1 Tax=Rubrimonas sp. TaxID=2036015 RepID=UPI002FDDDE7A